MASGCTTRMLGVCVALLLSSAAHAALLTDFDPSGTQSDTADRASHLLTGWAGDPQVSGSTGGALGLPLPSWVLEQTPTEPSGGAGSAPTFDLRPMLGGLNVVDFRIGAFDAQPAPLTPVPLPATLWLLASSAAALLPLLRRRALHKSALMA